MAETTQANTKSPSDPLPAKAPFLIMERQPDESEADWTKVIHELKAAEHLVVHQLDENTISLTRAARGLGVAA